jgi:general secretion pathway protein D
LPPIFTTRELRSNLQVENGQTLVLGGLIQRADQKIKRGIPLISRIPIVGWLFGWNSTVKKGSEIMMILTPRVVDTRDETDLLTKDFREKILGAMAQKDIRKLYNLEEPKKPAAAQIKEKGN